MRQEAGKHESRECRAGSASATAYGSAVIFLEAGRYGTTKVVPSRQVAGPFVPPCGTQGKQECLPHWKKKEASGAKAPGEIEQQECRG